MKLTIITVVFNGEKTIKDCIESVLKQNYDYIEYIIIDGNSSDSTLKIIKEYGENIDFVLSESDTGIYDAINKGINLATGDIIGILNSDDFFSDYMVASRIVESFLRDQKMEALFSDVKFVDKENTNKVLRYYSSKFFKPWMFKFGFQPAHPTFYARKELFDKYGLYRIDLKIAGDFELMLRFLLKNKIKYKYVNDMWVKMRIGGISTSGISSITQASNEIILAHKYNHLYTNKLLIYSKYLIKWWGFLRK